MKDAEKVIRRNKAALAAMPDVLQLLNGLMDDYPWDKVNALQVRFAPGAVTGTAPAATEMTTEKMAMERLKLEYRKVRALEEIATAMKVSTMKSGF